MQGWGGLQRWEMDSLGKHHFFPLLETSFWGWMMASRRRSYESWQQRFLGEFNPPSPKPATEPFAEGLYWAKPAPAGG